MKIRAYKRFKRAYRDLPKHIQKKTDKQLALLAENMQHPSLHTKKIKNNSRGLRGLIKLCDSRLYHFCQASGGIHYEGNR